MVRTPAPRDLDSGSRSGLLSLHEAAERLGVHYMTAYRYVRTGRLPATQVGAQWWVDPRDLAGAREGAAVAGRPRAQTRRSTRVAAARHLESRLVAGDEAGAWAIVEARLGSGTNPDNVLLDELALAMRSVGDGWEAGDYTVDDEHRASGVATRVVSRLGARFTRRGPKRRSVILGTPPHELHGLPTAMAANVLRGRGYDVADLGADVPADAFGAAVTKTARPLAVAVAVTAGNHDRSVRAIVRSVEKASPGLPVLVGGAGIAGEQHAARLGARWSGGDARQLGEVIEELDRRAR
jgi:excisionase family DNA binding protein